MYNYLFIAYMTGLELKKNCQCEITIFFNFALLASDTAGTGY